ncbi:MAG: EAL domain-containing protein, partial [Trueperaceae bacterium]
TELADPTLFDRIVQELADAHVAPERLELEVTESAVMADGPTALATLARLRDHGVRIAIDDFGTGYASLIYLRKVPARTLKIDASFVHDLNTGGDASERSLIEAVTNLGRAFGMEVVGEGIETPHQHQALRELGCRLGQGYLFGRPMPEAAFRSWWHPRSASAD